jgi:hypothetical protein
MALSRGILCVLALLAAAGGSLHAQTIEDGIMLPGKTLFFGDIYAHDSWDQYWQGTIERTNGNIGTVTTQSNTLYANYGVTGRFNVIGSVPYVWTHASQGVLHDMQGFQDLTLAAKYAFFERPVTKYGSLRLIALAVVGIPLTDYTPDFMPLSIGTHSNRIAARTTLNYQSNWGWFVNGSAAYTWRGSVKLDRPFYFTDGQFHMTDEVDMPNVFDYIASAGYLKRGALAYFSWAQEKTQGGGDIRRQDMPFVSNRVNYSRIGVFVMYPVPKFRSLAPLFAWNHVVDGRNIGHSDTFSVGLTYTLHFSGR